MRNGESMEYRILRSRRKTAALQITGEGLVVRVPVSMTDREVEAFVAGHEKWIRIHLEKAERARKNAGRPLTPAERRELARKAKEWIPQRVAYYAPLLGVDWGRITIRCQKTRWGSCSDRGNLNFNCLLMLTPPEVIDSVVVHELCHRKEMNHGKAFYGELLRVFPEYRRWNRWLKENGGAILLRAEVSLKGPR